MESDNRVFATSVFIPVDPQLLMTQNVSDGEKKVDRGQLVGRLPGNEVPPLPSQIPNVNNDAATAVVNETNCHNSNHAVVNATELTVGLAAELTVSTTNCSRHNSNGHDGGRDDNGEIGIIMTDGGGTRRQTSSQQSTSGRSLSSPAFVSPEERFNPLLLYTTTTEETAAVMRNDTHNIHPVSLETLSLTRSHLKHQLDGAIRRVLQDDDGGNTNQDHPLHCTQPPTVSDTGDKENWHRAQLSARLVHPKSAFDGDQPSSQSHGRWGIRIAGPRATLVQAARNELTRADVLSPPLLSRHADSMTAQSIERLLGDGTREMAARTVTTMEVSGMLGGPLLGPRHHAVQSALITHDCQVEMSSRGVLLAPVRTVSVSIAGATVAAVAAVQQDLMTRLCRLQEQHLPRTLVAIDADKLEWLWSSGTIRELDESLWRHGATLWQHARGGARFEMVALTEALLRAAMRDLQQMLARHQSLQLVLHARDDVRDFAPLQETFDSIGQGTNCAVLQETREQDGRGVLMVEIGGRSGDVARALMRLDALRTTLLSDTCAGVHIHSCRLRLQVSADIREFVCGKKDGKLNRIIKETGVSIVLEDIGGESMYIDLHLSGSQGQLTFGSTQLLHALRLVEGELPAELTFHVPELHHKRMIGHGGRTIQKIMKKWGVYVKFMNAAESHDVFNHADPLLVDHPPFIRPVDNVIVRTPAKNAGALDAIKEEIFAECCLASPAGLAGNSAGPLGAVDGQALRALQCMQPSNRTRVAISVATDVEPHLGAVLRVMTTVPATDVFLFGRNTLVVEGGRSDVSTMLALYAQLSGEVERDVDEVLPSSVASEASFRFFPSAVFVHPLASLSASMSASPLLDGERAQMPRLSPSWSQLLQELDSRNDVLWSPPPEGKSHSALSPALSSRSSSSVSMTSLGSPSMAAVGTKHTLSKSKSTNACILSNVALAETRRRSAELFE